MALDAPAIVAAQLKRKPVRQTQDPRALANPFSRLLHRVLAPVVRFITLRIAVDDPWDVTRFVPPPERFGPGSTHPFAWYFEGESSVEVDGIEDILEWLTGCEGASDKDLFNEADFWQHPRTFEELRKGDCEDHALWAWRKLVEMGVEAELFVGNRRDEHGHPRGGHAWVIFDDGGERSLLETTWKDATRMVVPLARVKADYIPVWSVGPQFKTKSYMGWYEVRAFRLRKAKELPNKR